MSDSTHNHDHCHPKKTDYLFYGSLSIVVIAYSAHLVFGHDLSGWQMKFTHGVYELLNTMAFGIVLGIFFAGLIGQIPRDITMGLLSSNSRVKGVLKATAGGLVFDLCSHGILLVGMRLYERGARLGQVMAFLIASPWNSISLTIILFTLIGVKWTLLFIVLSGLVAVLSGVVFDILEDKGVLPRNPYSFELDENFKVFPEAKARFSKFRFTPAFFKEVIADGLKESKMIIKWLLFGVIIASLMRAVLTEEVFTEYFGPTLLGLGSTLIFATVLEVCSEGSAPIAADLFSRAKAPGNAFGFLMTGVSTDYTEILSIRERTKSWKIALFLPLVTLPQVVLLAWLINHFS